MDYQRDLLRHSLAMQSMWLEIQGTKGDGLALGLALQKEQTREAEVQEANLSSLVPARKCRLILYAIARHTDFIFNRLGLTLKRPRLQPKQVSYVFRALNEYVLTLLFIVTPFGHLEAEEKSEEEKKVPAVRADESQPNCVACNEKFELFWDADQEDWMYKNAVVASDGFIYHTQCHAEEDESDQVPLPTEIGKKREFPEGVSTNRG
jgi:hypothetical protein